MPLPHTVVIVNPNSQGGLVGRRWGAHAATIREAFPFEAALTTACGDATRLTRQALRSGANRIVALGGDGTINEVVNGFFDEAGEPIAPDADLGLLPGDTGGDFRRTFAIPKDLAAAAGIVARGQRRRIDLGRLDFTTADGQKSNRLFANIGSFGISGVVARFVNASGKMAGRFSFYLATVRAMLTYRNQAVRVRFDNSADVGFEGRINTIAVANGRFFGGGMMVAPDAQIDDGAFDVVTLGDFAFSDLCLSGHRMYEGTHVQMAKVSQRRAQIVTAEPVDPQARVQIEIEGENVGRLPARFEIIPSALWLVVPP